MKRSVVVSIVAPVYNVEPYLPNFIDSVIGQTFTDWELLLVDDGSTDKSGKICDDYALKDERIKVIHKENGGVSSARNAGLKEMKGEWVLMPDPDDELPLDSLETLYKNTSDEIDLVSASYLWYKEGRYRIPVKQSFDKDYSRDEYASVMGVIPQPRNHDRRCCNKLFRASVITENHIYFPEDIHYREDVLYNYLYMEHVVRRVRCLSYNMYIYYMRDTGAALSLQESYTLKSGGKFISMTRCYDILEKIGASEKTKLRMKSEMLDAYKAISKLIDRTGTRKEDRISYFKKLRQYFSYWDLCLIGLRRLNYRYNHRIV
jgi:glycosyltransferase involved in cell wall biosynthesis